EGRRWTERVLALPGAGEPGQARARALVTAGLCAAGLGDHRAMVPYLEEAAALFRAGDNLAALGRTLGALGCYMPTTDASEAARAIALTDDGLALVRAVGGPHDIAMAEASAGGARLAHGGDLDVARVHLETAERLTRELGADYMALSAVRRLALLAEHQGLAA